MKKYYLCMMALVLTMCLMSACSNADEATEITEQAPTTSRHSILVRFADASQTRVAMQGVALDWSEDDAIAVLYKNKEESGSDRIVKYIYKETTVDGARFETETDNADGDWVSQHYDKSGIAYYPYPVYGSDMLDWYDPSAKTTINMSYETSLELGKTAVTMVGTEVEDDVYTFTVANAIFSVTVKNLPRNTFSTASVISYHYLLNSGKLNLYDVYLKGDVMPSGFPSTLYTERSFDLSPLNTGESGTVGQTFNFPIPTNVDLDDLTFTLKSSSDVVQDVTFKLATFTPKPNTKYSKVIALDEDGARKSLNAVEQANADLEVSGKVAVDLTNAASEETFYIPASVKGGTSVDITMSNAQWGNAVYLKQEENVENAKDVNLYHIESFTSSLTINLPNSNIYIDSDESSTYKDFYGALVVEKAKSFTWGKNDIVYMCGSSRFKEVSEVTVNCEVNGNTIEGSLTEEEPRTMTLTINNNFYGNTITGNIILTVVNNTNKSVTFNDKAITAPANATTVLHIVDGKLVDD